MTSRHTFIRLSRLIAIVVGPVSFACCTRPVGTMTSESPAPTSATAACSQQEMTAHSAALDVFIHPASPTDSVTAAIASSMRESRAAIAESEYRTCLASHAAAKN